MYEPNVIPKVKLEYLKIRCIFRLLLQIINLKLVFLLWLILKLELNYYLIMMLIIQWKGNFNGFKKKNKIIRFIIKLMMLII